MALLWCDSFDHYGTGSAGREAMLDGTYAEVGPTGCYPTAAISRTGANAMRLPGVSNTVLLRRIFGAAKTTAGVGYAIYLDELPITTGLHSLGSFCDFDNARQVIIALESTGAISAYRGTTSTLLGRSADGVLVTGAWQHLEMAVTISNTVGAVEVRVDQVTVLSLAGIDTQATSREETSQWRCGGLSNSGISALCWVDDLFAWDSSGSANNDFIGDRRVRTIFPTADTATAEWTPTGSATGYGAIDDSAPDGDTSYITAAPSLSSPPYVTSEFVLDNLPASVVSINGVVTVTNSKKTEAGTAMLQVSMLSGGYVSDGAEVPVTTEYTYRQDVHELDPATGAPWTPEGFNAAQLRIRRTE